MTTFLQVTDANLPDTTLSAAGVEPIGIMHVPPAANSTSTFEVTLSRELVQAGAVYEEAWIQFRKNGSIYSEDLPLEAQGNKVYALVSAVSTNAGDHMTYEGANPADGYVIYFELGGATGTAVFSIFADGTIVDESNSRSMAFPYIVAGDPVIPLQTDSGGNPVLLFYQGKLLVDSATRKLMTMGHGGGIVDTGTYTVEGLIFEGDGVTPTNDITVSIVGTSFTVQATYLGFYLISDVPAGTYDIAFTKTGYQDYTVTDFVVGSATLVGLTCKVPDVAMKLSVASLLPIDSVHNNIEFDSSNKPEIKMTIRFDLNELSTEGQLAELEALSPTPADTFVTLYSSLDYVYATLPVTYDAVNNQFTTGPLSYSMQEFDNGSRYEIIQGGTVLVRGELSPINYVNHHYSGSGPVYLTPLSSDGFVWPLEMVTGSDVNVTSMNSGASYASNPLVIQDSSSETYGVPSVKFEIQGMDDANCNWIMDFLIIDLARAFGKHAYTIFRNAWRDQYSVVLKVQQTGHPIQNATITIAPELNIEGGTEVLVTDSNGYAGTAEPSMHREGRYSVVSCDTSTFGGPFSVQQSNFEFRSVTVLPIELTVVMPLTEGNVTVFDDTTNMELDGATVSIVGYNGSTPWGSGVYHFSDVPWGDRYYLTATCPGYQDYTSSSPVTFASYGAVSLPDIRMIPL